MGQRRGESSKPAVGTDHSKCRCSGSSTAAIWDKFIETSTRLPVLSESTAYVDFPRPLPFSGETNNPHATASSRPHCFRKRIQEPHNHGDPVHNIKTSRSSFRRINRSRCGLYTDKSRREREGQVDAGEHRCAQAKVESCMAAGK